MVVVVGPRFRKCGCCCFGLIVCLAAVMVMMEDSEEEREGFCLAHSKVKAAYASAPPLYHGGRQTAVPWPWGVSRRASIEAETGTASKKATGPPKATIF